MAGNFEKGMEAVKRGDCAGAFAEWKPLAEQGHARAQFNLGVMYANGDGVPQDYREMARWFHMAAEQGHAEAQFNLGTMYDNGNGVPEEDDEAVKWYRMAAEQGHAEAQFNLGVMCATGRGAPQDDGEAATAYDPSCQHPCLP